MKKTITLFFLLFAFLVKAQTTLNLKFFIQGYYRNGTTPSDSVTVELRDTIINNCFVVASYNGIFMSNGTMTCNFAASITGHSYYIVVNHRSTQQTWSASPVAFTTTTNYDFTTSDMQAYCRREWEVAPGVWAFPNGDTNGDENVDLLDLAPIDSGIIKGDCNGNPVADFNGDGNADIIDYTIFDYNMCWGTFGCTICH